jgi:hypothetical protein
MTMGSGTAPIVIMTFARFALSKLSPWLLFFSLDVPILKKINIKIITDTMVFHFRKIITENITEIS